MMDTAGFQKILLMSKKEGLSNVEISEYLNISIKTVEAHITKAFCVIREKVDCQINSNTILFLLFEKS